MRLYACRNQNTQILKPLTILSHFILNVVLLILISSVFSIAYSQENAHRISITPASNVKKYDEKIKSGDLYYEKKKFSLAIVQYVDAIKYLTGNDTDTKQILSVVNTKIGDSYRYLKEWDQTVHYYEKSLNLFSILQDKKSMASVLNSLAEAQRHLGNLVAALDHSTQSLGLYKTVDEPQGQTKALIGAGVIYRHIGLYEKSLYHIKMAYAYYKEIEDGEGIAKTSNELGHIYVRLKQFDEAKFFFQQTIDISREQIKSNILASALRGIAVSEFHHKNYDSAMEFAKKAYNVYQENNSISNQTTTARVMGNIYRAKKDYDNAITLYNKSYSLAVDNNNEKHQVEAKVPLAEIFIVREPAKAVKILLSVLELAIKLEDEKQQYHIYNKLRRSEDYRENFKQAFEYAKKEIDLGLSIQKKSEQKKLVLAKAALHSHKVEVELESLKEKSKLDQLELTRKNNEIEIGEQSRTINELKLIKNKYATIALACLLIICVLLIIFTYRSFIQSKKRNKELGYLASRDPLTNCYNRRSLFEIMTRYLESPISDENTCLIMVDIDYFKRVNDTYGHTVGDNVIRGVASILQHSIRQNDIVGRFGGEEFCIFMHQVTLDQAMNIAEHMRQSIESSTFDDVSVTSSFGLTSTQLGSKELSQLIEQADLALYKSKSLGRNKVTIWNELL